MLGAPVAADHSGFDVISTGVPHLIPHSGAAPRSGFAPKVRGCVSHPGKGSQPWLPVRPCDRALRGGRGWRRGL